MKKNPKKQKYKMVWQVCRFFIQVASWPLNENSGGQIKILVARSKMLVVKKIVVKIGMNGWVKDNN